LRYRETDKCGAAHRSTRPDPDEDPRAENQLFSRAKTDYLNATMGVDKAQRKDVDGKLDEQLQFQT
jgi:hypothetical protein